MLNEWNDHSTANRCVLSIDLFTLLHYSTVFCFKSCFFFSHETFDTSHEIYQITLIGFYFYFTCECRYYECKFTRWEYNRCSRQPLLSRWNERNSAVQRATRTGATAAATTATNLPTSPNVWHSTTAATYDRKCTSRCTARCWGQWSPLWDAEDTTAK